MSDSLRQKRPELLIGVRVDLRSCSERESKETTYAGTQPTG